MTVYLDGTGDVDADGLPLPRWVVFSAHDETGDDLRRRWDDPDLSLVDGRHPVVFAGAGSHSGAYLAGDYLITVAPPSLGGLIPTVRRAAKVLTPWTRAAQGSGLGIPYIDYARGDGLTIGPGPGHRVDPVVIDDETPWVRDYRGLWGHDTSDRLGGERGPAGPRYERNATVRAVVGRPGRLGRARQGRAEPGGRAGPGRLSHRATSTRSSTGSRRRRPRVGTSIAEKAAGLPPSAPRRCARSRREEQRLVDDRMTAVRLRDERERMVRAQRGGHADGRPARPPESPADPDLRQRARTVDGSSAPGRS